MRRSHTRTRRPRLVPALALASALGVWFCSATLPAQVGAARFLTFESDWTPCLHGPDKLPWMLRQSARMDRDKVALFRHMLARFLRRHGLPVPRWEPTASDKFNYAMLVLAIVLVAGMFAFVGLLLWGGPRFLPPGRGAP